jgi:hypothetical protein
MKQALVSLIRTVVRGSSSARTAPVALVQLSRVQLRSVAGGGGEFTSPKSAW